MATRGLAPALLIITLLWTSGGHVVGGACPEGWERGGVSCYMVQPTDVDHASAVDLCSQYQANLVSISTREEYTLLQQLLSAAGRSVYWIGLTTTGAGGYSWSDGSGYSAAVVHWQNGTAGYGYFGPATSCAIVDSASGLVSFRACEERYRPLCERSATVDYMETCNTEDGWQDIDGACYKLYNVPSTWAEARQECLRHSGDLYIPGSSPYVIDKILSCRNTVTHVWVGVSDTRTSGTLQTVNGSQYNGHWDNMDSSVRDPGNTCQEVVTSAAGGLHYRLDLCSHEKQFLCRKAHGTCPAGWDQHGARCYGWHTTRSEITTWFLAKQACAAQGAQLLVLHNMDGHTFVTQRLLQDKVSNVWLGFSDQASSDQLQWVDGSAANGTGVFDVWAPNFPDPLPGKVDCGVLQVGRNNGTWSHGYCYDTRAYVCDIPVGTALTSTSPGVTYDCDVGWALSGNQCYYFGSKRDTWNASSATCETQEAHLAVINDPTIQSFLRMHLPDTTTAWIGLRLERRDMHYYWQDATPASFVNYAPGEPDGRDRGEDCIAITATADYPGAWIDFRCNASLDFVCQKPAVQTSGPTLSSPATHPWTYRCGLGWRLNSETGACYLVQVGSPKNWEAAMFDCRRRGGDLLSLSGPKEQQFVQATLQADYGQYQDPFWIGATDSTVEGGWEWSDGSPFRYLNWHPGEPNDVGVGEDCVQMVVAWDYTWNDNNCDNAYTYVCKKPAAPVTFGSTPVLPTVPAPSQCVDQSLISGVYSLQSRFSFSSSTDLDSNHTAMASRLLDSNPFAWRPSQDKGGEYVEVHFYQTMSLTSITVGGEPNSFSFVTKYKIQYQYNSHTPWYWVEGTDGTPMVFDGPTDDTESSAAFFPTAIQAQRVRLFPQEWGTHIAVQWELTGCVAETCQTDYAVSGPLVVMDGALTATSMSDSQHTPHAARLRPIAADTPPSCWRSGEPFDPASPPWIQVDLGTIKLLTGVTVMGNPDADEYVTLFQVHVHLNDGSDTFVPYQEPFGTPKNITGNTDNNGTVTYMLKSVLPVQHVRIVPLAFHNHISLRFDLLVCSLATCRDIPLLSGKHNVSDSAFSASSSLDPEHGPFMARLGLPGGAWVARYTDNHQYIQVDLQEAIQIWAVATQGSAELGQWVTAYTLAFSMDGKTFSSYSYNGQSVWTFDGNYDASSVRKHYITVPTVARHVQLWPVDYRNGIALRWEIYGCPGPEAGQLIGCFLDDPLDRDLPAEPLIDPLSEVGPESCRYHCFQKGYAYAGLQRGIACYCGDTYGKYGESEMSCTVSCLPPYQQSRCGGPNANSVYNTGLAPLHKYCNPGWTSNGDWCYTVNTDPLSWFSARDTCRQYGGDLVSIDSLVENDLIFSAVTATGDHNGSAWIGLNDLHQSLLYEWSGGSQVLFTNWDVNQPVASPTREQHCVAISNQTGGWKTMFCERSLMYVCKMAKQPSPIPHLPPIAPGCQQGYHAFLSSCYRLVSQLRDLVAASRVCQTAGSTLARITDRFEQAFVASLLGSESGYFWTDVSDVLHPTVYRFSDMTSAGHYTQWGPGQPGAPRQCVALATGSQAGLWYTFNCSTLHHAICEKPRDGFTAAPTPPILPPTAHCPPGWLQTNYTCYQAYRSSQLSWDEAHADCESIGADLATFHSQQDLHTVWTQLMAGARSNFWIGLHYSMQSSSLKWSDGSGVNFLQWEPGQTAAVEGLLNCVEVTADSGNMVHENCFALRHWLCSIRRGQMPKPRTTVVYPTAGKPGSCSPFNDNWKFYAGSCYLLVEGTAEDGKSWRGARDVCRGMGVDLVSITSVQEQLFVQSLLVNVTGEGLWTGLNELDMGHGMKWSDGSPTTYENWDVNEPNHFGYLEWCVDILTRNGKWNDEVCSRKLGYICEQNTAFSPPPSTHSTPPSGFCPSGYATLGTKCFRIFGSGLGESLRSWHQAWDFCRAFGPGYSLASITSAEENLFITSMMGGQEMAVWFGLQRQPDGTFAWTDNSDTIFSNWDEGEPSGGVSSCVYIRGSQRYAGLWNDAPCGQSAHYVCQTHIDSRISTPEAIPNPCDARLGFEPFKAGCYKFVSTTLNFTAAASKCQQWAADLPVVDNAYTQAFLQLFVARQAGVHADTKNAPSFWIGLSDLTQSGVYTWTVGWPVTYSNWAPEEPSRGPGEGCVSVASDGLWADGDCSQQLPFVCVVLNANYTTYTPQPPSGKCIGQDWVARGDRCYLFRGDERRTFFEAEQSCRQQGANLAAVHSNDTLQFLAAMVLPQTPYSVWIGLYGSQSVGFSWLDRSPVEFVSWAAGQPSGVNDQQQQEHCVAMSPNTRTWDDLACTLRLGYICSKPQEIDPEQETRPPVRIPEMTPATRYDVPNKTPMIPPKRSTTPQLTPPPPGVTTTPAPPGVSRRPMTVQTAGPSSTPPEGPVTQAQKGAGIDTAHNAAVAGSVIATLLVLVTLAAILLYVRQKQQVGIFARPHHETTFANILYNFAQARAKKEAGLEENHAQHVEAGKGGVSLQQIGEEEEEDVEKAGGQGKSEEKGLKESEGDEQVSGRGNAVRLGEGDSQGSDTEA